MVLKSSSCYMYFHSAFIVLKDVLQKFAPCPYNWGNPIANTIRDNQISSVTALECIQYPLTNWQEAVRTPLAKQQNLVQFAYVCRYLCLIDLQEGC
jgi:hypothetical protein